MKKTYNGIPKKFFNKKFLFISDEKGSKLVFVSIDVYPRIEISYKKDNQLTKEEINLDEVADVRGWKAMGTKLTLFKVQQITPLAPKIVEVAPEPEVSVDIPVSPKLVPPEEISTLDLS